MTNINSEMPHILVIEDDPSLSRSIKLNLDLAGFPCEVAYSAKQAAHVLKDKEFNIIVCDQQLPDIEGIEFIKNNSKNFPETYFVLMTGFGNNDLALSAILAGAFDYISKPFSVEQLLFLLKKISALNIRLNTNTRDKIDFKDIVVKSDSMQSVFSTVQKIANFNTTVLIQGESGTGKELIARAIHQSSSRANKPFVAINCGAIPENLIESELFGHKKGAFTDAVRDKIGLFEEASGGTIFLDEIGELPLSLQVKLLRVLQEQQIQPVGEEKPRSIDVRIISATLRNLEEDIKTGCFRDDLFFRLNVINIKIPALKERPEDIPALANYFLNKYNKKLGTKIKNIEPETLQKLISYTWRGNVRELENCIERAIVLSEGNTITLESLPSHIKNSNTNLLNHELSIENSETSSNLSIKQHTEAIERKLIAKALKETKGNRTKAALLLEISHRALLYKLKEYNIA
jgi:two-component system response regulator AtoC